jgi:two-component system, chemotaxis family, sensor kinase CheA
VLPLTLVTTRVLLVHAGDHLFGVPASGCLGSIWIRPEKIRTVEGRAMLDHEGALVPVVRLDALLELGEARPLGERRAPALLIGSAKRPLAMIVDQMVDEREVVVKPLGPLMDKQRRYSGAMQLGDGRLALLLNPMALAQVTRGAALTASTGQGAAARRQHLLVTDDSFATRELIRSILHSAGYEVTTAVDGLDALDKLRAARFDLVVSDVEMPRVDGFTLTSRIRTELERPDLPVIIMTSLASEQHRRRGLEVGAQAYIVKSQFNQGNLLETIRQLLGG